MKRLFRMEGDGPTGEVTVLELTDPVRPSLCRPFILADPSRWKRNHERPFQDPIGDLIDLRCVRDGRNPIALASSRLPTHHPDFPPSEWGKIVGLYHDTMHEIRQRGGGFIPADDGGVIAYSRGNKRRAEALHDVMKDSIWGEPPWAAPYHILMGRLLGYDKKHVQAWLYYSQDYKMMPPGETETAWEAAKEWFRLRRYPDLVKIL